MKIGYVLTNLLLGGVQTFFADLAVEFARIYEVKYTVLSMENADPLVIELFGNVQRVSPEELLRWSDIIHLDGIMTNEDKRMFKPKWNRTIETIGSARNFSLVDRIFKRNLPPYLVAMSKYIGNSLRVKHRVSYCCVDTDKFKPLDIEKKYDLVMIGRMRPVKNHALFLEICRKGNFSFLTIGGTHRRLEGHVNDIEKMVRAQAVEGRDYVAGFVPNEDVVPLLNQAKMAVVTSHSEALGYNSLEPMACGVPVVSRRVGGTPEVHGEDSDMLVSYNASAEVYVEKIKKYVDDIELRKRVRQRVVEKFSLKKSIADYNELYQEVLENA
jgi:glycosyltransferase involved in cell wall biosynthesis